MAVSEQTPYIEYTANGTTTSFALDFDCDNQDHLIVLVDDIEPVVGTWSFSNGAVVFNTAPENGKKITLQRNTPFSRTTDYQSYNNSFRPPAVNNDFDRVWYKIQELGVKDWLLDLKIQKFRDDVNLTALENTLEEAKQIRDDTADSVVEVQSNVAQSQTLLGNTTAQANLAQGYANSANSANAAAQQAVIDVSTAEADVYSALSAQQIAVNNSLTAIAGGHKAYQTLAAAQAAQATLPVNTVVEVTNDGANNGTYQWNGTTLTKSAYDPLTQARTYTDNKVKSVTNNFKTKTLMVASTLPNDSYAMVTEDTEANNGLYVKTAGAWVKSAYVPALRDEYSRLLSGILTEVDDRLSKITGAYLTVDPYQVMGYKVNEAVNITTLYISDLYTLNSDITELTLNAWGSSTIPMCVFFDSDLRCVGAEYRTSSGAGNSTKVVPVGDIPINTMYVRFTGNGSYGSIVGATLVTDYEGNVLSEWLDKKLDVDTLQKLTAEIENPYLEGEGYYVHVSQGYMPVSGTQGLTLSPIYKLNSKSSSINVKGWSWHPYIALYAFLDENQNIIKTNGLPEFTTAGARDYTIPAEAIPNNAEYIRFTGRVGYPSEIAGEVTPLPPPDYRLIDYVKDNLPLSLVESNIKTTFITGASLAMPSTQKWFEIANAAIGSTPINKAVSSKGTLIDANMFWRGTLITDSQFDDIDVFCFQYSTSPHIGDMTGLLPTADDYVANFDMNQSGNPFSIYSDAQQFDFILKFLTKKAYEQRNNPSSKWYGTVQGKPLNFLFVTHWHDSRPYYSDELREVAARWGAAVCEFDKKIGFSKHNTLPNGSQISTLYAYDNQVTAGVTYGWHPAYTGSNGNYIQNKMASILKRALLDNFAS